MPNVLAELLRFIAANEDLPRALVRYPGYDRAKLGTLIAAAADRVEELEASKVPPPGAGSKGIKVRTQTDDTGTASTTGGLASVPAGFGAGSMGGFAFTMARTTGRRLRTRSSFGAGRCLLGRVSTRVGGGVSDGLTVSS